MSSSRSAHTADSLSPSSENSRHTERISRLLAADARSPASGSTVCRILLERASRVLRVAPDGGCARPAGQVPDGGRRDHAQGPYATPAGLRTGTVVPGNHPLCSRQPLVRGPRVSGDCPADRTEPTTTIGAATRSRNPKARTVGCLSYFRECARNKHVPEHHCRALTAPVRRKRLPEPGEEDRNRLPKPGSEVPPVHADASRSAGPGTIHSCAHLRRLSPRPQSSRHQTVTADDPVATLVASPGVASCAHRNAVAISYGCREAHRGFRDALELGRRARPRRWGISGGFEALIPRDVRHERVWA